MTEVAEGVRNTRATCPGDPARSVAVEMPITEQMHLLLCTRIKSPRQVVIDLMTRGLKREID